MIFFAKKFVDNLILQSSWIGGEGRKEEEMRLDKNCT